MAWIFIPLLTCLAAIVALVASKPENKRSAIFCVCLLVILAVLDASNRYDSKRKGEEIQTVAYERLSLYNSRFLGLLSIMIEEASDGWLPTNEEEFFSRKSVDLICGKLNAQGIAPVIPEQSWSHWFARQSSEYQKNLGIVLGNFSPYLPATTVRELAAVEGSLFLSLIPQLQAGIRQQTLPPSPFLCHGLEKPFAESFAYLAALTKEIKKGEKDFNLIKTQGWRQFPLPQRDSGRLGKNRLPSEPPETPGKESQK